MKCHFCRRHSSSGVIRKREHWCAVCEIIGNGRIYLCKRHRTSTLDFDLRHPEYGRIYDLCPGCTQWRDQAAEEVIILDESTEGACSIVQTLGYIQTRHRHMDPDSARWEIRYNAHLRGANAITDYHCVPHHDSSDLDSTRRGVSWTATGNLAVVSVPDNMTLLWSDEFDGTALDEAKWSFEIGNNNGWGNKELEYYTRSPQNCGLHDSSLVITARNENHQGCNYTSARITTKGKFSFRYGKIEARIKTPYGKGIWPAFWLLGENIGSVGWPSCGEIDIMELIGGGGTNESTVHGTIHWEENGCARHQGGHFSLAGSRLSDDFHLFGVNWDSHKILFYIDDSVYLEIPLASDALKALKNKFFIILNVAVGGQWPGNPDGTTVFPQAMMVDYVRVYGPRRQARQVARQPT